MTTIAYKDGVMASDSLAAAGTMNTGDTPKVFRIHGCLVGISGTARLIRVFTDWFAEHMDSGDVPPIAPNFLEPKVGSEDSIYAIVVTPNGKIWKYEDGLAPWPLDCKFIACGSGRDFAMGAMAMGAGAVKAVEVAKSLDAFTGGKTVAFTLGLPRKSKKGVKKAKPILPKREINMFPKIGGLNGRRPV